MEKKEILEKYKQSQTKDELEIHAEGNGAKIAFFASGAVAIIIMFICLFFKQRIALHAVLTVFWAQSAGYLLGQYFVTKRRKYIFAFAIDIIIAIISFILFLNLVQENTI